MARIDERNIMFSRISRVEGTNQYNDYYKEHPENKEFDDRLRSLPPMNGDQTKYFDPLNSPIVDSTFEFLADIKGLVDGGQQAKQKVVATPAVFTEKLQGLAALYGAKLTGVAELDESYYYSIRGRNDQVYGEKVEPKLPYTFVFAVEMDPAYINTAPALSQSIAVTKGYLDAAIIGMMLAYYIKSLGYEARNHMDGNYLLVMPLAAKAAGLGDLGRHGLLVTSEFGSRIRLGAVTTDLPLIKSEASLFQVRDFCEQCGRCAGICPARAIAKEPAQMINGVKRWQIKQELCFEKWLEFGTDCGLCMASCPFSLPIEQTDIEEYNNNPDFAKVILEKYKVLDFRRKIDKKELVWLNGSI